MRWYSAYRFEVTLQQNLKLDTLLRYDRYYLFTSNSSDSFHRVGLKVSVQLDLEKVQGLLFCGYSTPSFDRVITTF